jgi:DNA-binding MarR family transcriptional regulator
MSSTEVAGAIRLLVARLHRVLRQQADVTLSPTKQSFLSTIARREPITLGGLASAEGVAPPTVTKVVSELERLELVQRSVDPDDRRISHVRVSAKGHEVLDAIRTRKTAWLVRKLDELDAESLQRLADALPILEFLAGTGPLPGSDPSALSKQ